MTHYIIKAAISAAVVAVAEIFKQSTFMGGLLASLPLVPLPGMISLYADAKEAQKVRNSHPAFLV